MEKKNRVTIIFSIQKIIINVLIIYYYYHYKYKFGLCDQRWSDDLSDEETYFPFKFLILSLMTV